MVYNIIMVKIKPRSFGIQVSRNQGLISGKACGKSVEELIYKSGLDGFP